MRAKKEGYGAPTKNVYSRSTVHVMQRGNNSEATFLDDQDYGFFRKLMGEVKQGSVFLVRVLSDVQSFSFDNPG
jgi:hypothetical protein